VGNGAGTLLHMSVKTRVQPISIKVLEWFRRDHPSMTVYPSSGASYDPVSPTRIVDDHLENKLCKSLTTNLTYIVWQGWYTRRKGFVYTIT
jgi:hypothetical protein